MPSGPTAAASLTGPSGPEHDLTPPIAQTVAGTRAFAVSFDEVIVTTFTAGQQTTLPIWMLGSASWCGQGSGR